MASIFSKYRDFAIFGALVVIGGLSIYNFYILNKILREPKIPITAQSDSPHASGILSNDKGIQTKPATTAPLSTTTQVKPENYVVGGIISNPEHDAAVRRIEASNHASFEQKKQKIQEDVSSIVKKLDQLKK